MATGSKGLSFGGPVGPSPPTDMQVNGVAAVDEQATGVLGAISASALAFSASKKDARLLAQLYVKVDNVGLVLVAQQFTPWVLSGKRSTTVFYGLTPSTLYTVRFYSQNRAGALSTNFTQSSFWTDRAPVATITGSDNVTYLPSSSVPITWTYTDADSQNQDYFSVRYRSSATPVADAGPWNTVVVNSGALNYSIPAGLPSSTRYEAQVAVRDVSGMWSDWSLTRFFSITGTTRAPVLLGPPDASSMVAEQVQVFNWKFLDPEPGDTQSKADLRYRNIGGSATSWVLIAGTTTTPGATQSLSLPSYTFTPAQGYEWQVRTYDAASNVSDWSVSRTFYATITPGSLVTSVDLNQSGIIGELGCGEYRVFVYTQGGQRMVGEITDIVTGQWARKRDDISGALITVKGWGTDCGDLLGRTRSWMHEIVIFRDLVRVWEGPITRIEYTPTSVTIEAKDVMAYMYRRILRQGYNDSYNLSNGVQLGLKSVVDRAYRITLNALGYSDPNVLGYLTPISYPDDTIQSRVIPDYSKTAWQEIDDLARTAGLDYVTVGRRIIYNDTHRPLGRLAEMRDEHFSDPPVVTEYGMNLANYFGVTNGSGIWGSARPSEETTPYMYYGPIEQLASAYGEASGGSEDTSTPDAVSALQASFNSQAQRNIDGRWTTPLIVRVPDNAQIAPDAPVTINQIVPGVWIPLRSKGTLREVSQWQKLDSMQATFDSGGEKVTVVMSPAPRNGDDPDANDGTAPDA